MQQGKYNAITDVPGIRVGHYAAETTGITVILTPPDGAVAGVDVRGSAPATRETESLRPGNLVERVHAVVLSGGSAFGLASVDGVLRYLEEQGTGFSVDSEHVVPIVPAAALYDLGRGRDWSIRPTTEFGYRACQAAQSEQVVQGNVGAGAGAVAGGLKSGIGTASVVLEGGMIVGALVAVNAYGSTVDPTTGQLYAAVWGLSDEFDHLEPTVSTEADTPNTNQMSGHTTLGVIATNVRLNKAQVNKVAQMTHDGMARAINPIHTMFDGDAIFALSTNEIDFQSSVEAPFGTEDAIKVNAIGTAAADTFARAIGHAMLAAQSVFGVPCYREKLLRED